MILIVDQYGSRTFLNFIVNDEYYMIIPRYGIFGPADELLENIRYL